MITRLELHFKALLFVSAAVLVAGLAGPAGQEQAAPIGATTADFNGDGYGDLAASSSGSGGAVNVLYVEPGQPRDQRQSESSEFFGGELMVNNYGRSVEADLAVGVYLEDFVAGFAGDGIVAVLYGSLPGPTSTGNQIWSLDSAGVPGSASNASFFGQALG